MEYIQKIRATEIIIYENKQIRGIMQISHNSIISVSVVFKRVNPLHKNKHGRPCANFTLEYMELMPNED